MKIFSSYDDRCTICGSVLSASSIVVLNANRGEATCIHCHQLGDKDEKHQEMIQRLSIKARQVLARRRNPIIRNRGGK